MSVRYYGGLGVGLFIVRTIVSRYLGMGANEYPLKPLEMNALMQAVSPNEHGARL